MPEKEESLFDDWWGEYAADSIVVASKKEVAEQAFLAGYRAAQQCVQPTVLTHSPNCALVKSLVADCNCGFDKSHSG